MTSEIQEVWREERVRRLAADLSERVALQQSQRERAVARSGREDCDDGEDSKYWIKKKESSGRIVGGKLLPREPYSLLKKLKVGDLCESYFWGMAHSWVSNFGLYGPIAEEDHPRMRCLVTQSVPPIVLLELNSVPTFNMLDPVLSTDLDCMQEAVQDLLMRTRDSNNYPLGYVLQGAGPHFCPGGNHHPPNPPGGTPWTMSTYATSHPQVRFREHSMPGITAITGSAVGGGVAISTNTTQRVVASNASMAFGNLSRGASPLMWLSGNLVAEMGMANAVAIYLEDSTFSAYGCLKAGMAVSVSPFKEVKQQAMQVSKRIASTSAGRLLSQHLIKLDARRYLMEAAGFNFNSRSGTMFANVKKAAAAAETAAPPLAVRSKRQPALADVSEDADNSEAEEQRDRQQQQEEPPSRRERPQPFPERVGLRPIQVALCDTACAQCGGRGSDGTIYGNTYYCAACWPRMGLSLQTADPQLVSTPPMRTKHSCSTCHKASSGGRWGAGMYSSEFYCSGC